MEIEQIDKKCSFCRDEAQAKFTFSDRTMEICKSCAKELFWALSKAENYTFEDD